jgi:hypothetical protein
MYEFVFILIIALILLAVCLYLNSEKIDLANTIASGLIASAMSTDRTIGNAGNTNYTGKGDSNDTSDSICKADEPTVSTDSTTNSSLKSCLRIKDLTKSPRSKSEAGVIAEAESLLGVKFPTVYPCWLMWKSRTLELDGYNENTAIAIEFSGPLHTKWDRNETYLEYYERIVRDIVKIRLCRKNKVDLIVVDASLPREHWRHYLLSRFADIYTHRQKTSSTANKLLEETLNRAAMTKDSPSYIREQRVPVYRNKKLEKQLNLVDIKIAKRM